MLTKKSVSKIISYLLVLILSMESIELGGFSSIKAYGGGIKSTISLNGLEDAYFKGDIIFKDGSDQKIDLSKDNKGAYVFYNNDLPIKISNPIKYANEFTGWSRAESTDAFKDVVISEAGNYTYNANFEMNNVLIYYDDDVACQNYNGTPLTEFKRTQNEILTKTGKYHRIIAD